jgi:hypothetical protein
VKHRKKGRRRAPENKALQHGPVVLREPAPENKAMSLEAMEAFAEGFKDYAAKSE